MKWWLAAKGYDAFQLHKARRKAKMVNKVISKVLSTIGLERFSKMVAVPVGAAIGFLVLKLPFLSTLITEEWTAAVTLTIATTIVGLFPANEA